MLLDNLSFPYVATMNKMYDDMSKHRKKNKTGKCAEIEQGRKAILIN